MGKCTLADSPGMAPATARKELRSGEDDAVSRLMPDTLDVLALIAGYRLLCRVAVREHRLPGYAEFCGRLCGRRSRDGSFSDRLAPHHYKALCRSVTENVQRAAERRFELVPCSADVTDRSRRVAEYRRQWTRIQNRNGRSIDGKSLDASRKGPAARSVECVETGDSFRSVLAAAEWVRTNTVYAKCKASHIRTALKRGRRIAKLTFRETGAERQVFSRRIGPPLELAMAG